MQMAYTLSGRKSFQRKNQWLLTKVMFEVIGRRLVGNSLGKSWTPGLEMANAFLREQMKYAFTLPNPDDAREFVDSLVLKPVNTPAFRIEIPKPDGPRGAWFVPQDPAEGRTLLYLHGGGYGFYAKSHASMIALFAHAAKAKTFALDYRLTPEHPHPAQIEDAVACYQWLLANGTDPSRLIVAGDSAGGHLTLMLLIELRRLGLPQPALAVGICPWTDIGHRGESLLGNNQYDWIQGEMALKFGEWYKNTSSGSTKTLSPIYQDLTGLAPMYLQAGEKEILVDMIRDFAREAKSQGADVRLDVWKDMTHDFQAFGDMLAQSAEALARFGQEIDRRCPGQRETGNRT
jgi:acetyl esterase/lipase